MSPLHDARPWSSRTLYRESNVVVAKRHLVVEGWVSLVEAGRRPVSEPPRIETGG
jgi:hypothetical protein